MPWRFFRFTRPIRAPLFHPVPGSVCREKPLRSARWEYAPFPLHRPSDSPTFPYCRSARRERRRARDPAPYRGSLPPPSTLEPNARTDSNENTARIPEDALLGMREISPPSTPYPRSLTMRPSRSSGQLRTDQRETDQREHSGFNGIATDDAPYSSTGSHGRRTPDAGRRTPDAGRRTPDAGRR